MIATQHGSADSRFILLTACIFAAIAGGHVLRRLGVVKPAWAGRMAPYWKKALGSAAIKFLVNPLMMLVVTLAMGMAGATDLRPMYVCVLLSAMPTALYSVLMANLFGLNRDLANTTFILTHAICFAVAIPAIGFWYAAA